MQSYLTVKVKILCRNGLKPFDIRLGTSSSAER